MSVEFKNKMREVMVTAWQLIKVYGFSKAEALKKAWLTLKLKAALHRGIVKFMYEKLDGTIRTAWGTLEGSRLPEGKGSGRKPNSSLVVYFDTEKDSFRSCKLANLIKIETL